MVTAIRHSFRLSRFELIAIWAFGLLVTVGAFVVAGRLDAIGYDIGCQQTDDVGNMPQGCESAAEAFWRLEQAEAAPLVALIAIAPYVIGLFLGGPILAREMERGTARLAWSIAPSRARWYAARVVPIVIAAAGIAFLVGVASDRLTAARVPGLDVSQAFVGFGQRGALVAVQALVMTAGSIGLGAVLGRQLPTVIVALILGVPGVLGVSHLHEQMTRSEAVVVTFQDVGLGDRWVDQRFQLPDGRLVGWAELETIDPVATTDGLPSYPEVLLVIPGERYREIEAREAAVLIAIALVMLAGAAIVVHRRRPG